MNVEILSQWIGGESPVVSRSGNKSVLDPDRVFEIDIFSEKYFQNISSIY